MDHCFDKVQSAARGGIQMNNLCDAEAVCLEAPPVRHFDEAGYGDMFYSPTNADWTELEKRKLPDLDAPLTGKLPLDTLYSLLAFADFAKFQEEMDAQIHEQIRHLF
jgi:hypothetical protein